MSKEYIDREAALSAIKQALEKGEGPSLYIKRIPAADVAPVRHGRWKEWWPGIAVIMTGEEMLYRCSVCDAKYSTVENYHYYPNCGAKMDGKELKEEEENREEHK